MSKFAVRGIVAATLALATSTGFTFQQAQPLQVTATIAGTCTLTISNPMAFGELNMTATSPQTTISTASYRCAAGYNVPANGFTVGGSSSGSYTGAMSSITTGVTATIPYSITWSQPGAFTGVGLGGTGPTVVLNGSIATGDFLGKPVASYADNIIVAINY